MKASVLLGVTTVILGVVAASPLHAVALDGGANSGEGTASTSQPGLSNPIGSNTLQPGQIFTSSEIANLPCYDTVGNPVGFVQGVVRDARTSEIAGVVLRVQGFLGLNNKNVAVKPSDLVVRSNSVVTVGYTKRQLQRIVDYRLNYTARYP
jgi:sporulation protein YlmC with PRC-barrel domain